MRTRDEIQRAHDQLAGAIALFQDPESPIVCGDEETLRVLRLCLSSLCWVMEHDHHDDWFEGTLRELDEYLRRHGYQLKDNVLPMTLEEIRETDTFWER